jgi:hypothetical protein
MYHTDRMSSTSPFCQAVVDTLLRLPSRNPAVLASGRPSPVVVFLVIRYVAFVKIYKLEFYRDFISYKPHDQGTQVAAQSTASSLETVFLLTLK